MKRVIRRIVLLFFILLLIAGVSLGVNYYINQKVYLTRYSYQNEKLPRVFDGYRIAVISDIHNSPHTDQFIALLNQSQPDLLLFDGDMIQKPSSDLSHVLKIIASQSDRIPVYVIFGNHEAANGFEQREQFRQQLEHSGAEVLLDAGVDIVRDEEQIRIIGVEDVPGETVDGETIQNIHNTVQENVREDTVNILAYHRANVFPEIHDLPVDLVLSGHMHGGLLRLPFVGGVLGRQGELFPDYTAGVYTEMDTTMIVSRGCDANPEKPRIFNPPEIVEITLQRTASGGAGGGLSLDNTKTFNWIALGMALVMVICLLLTFWGLVNSNEQSSTLLGSVPDVKKYYTKRMTRHDQRSCSVIYINLFLENLRIMTGQKDLEYIQDRVEREVFDLCGRGHGEAARVDGNNYIIATDASLSAIESFCNHFLHAERRGFKKIEFYIGGFTADERDIDFSKAAGYAKKASRVAKTNGEKYLLADKKRLRFILENDNIVRNIEIFIDSDDFYQVYHPMIDTCSGRVLGCEMLTRLRDKNVQGVTPGKFLDVIKKERLCAKFDMYVFKRCCEWSVKQASRGLIVSCKFDESTLAQENSAEDMIQIAAQAGAVNSDIVIETGQNYAGLDWEIFRENVARLKRAGFKLCLDNFGQGIVSLGDLPKLCPNYIKLDRSIIQSSDDPMGRAVLDSIVGLGRGIGAKIICSGVERPEHLKTAMQVDCDMLQGFYFCRPLNEEDFDRLLHERLARSSDHALTAGG